MKIPVFYYHSVGGPPPQTLPLPVFRRHLELLARHGFRTVPLGELLRGRPEGRVAVLTFDDGLLDNHAQALPLLREFGFRATFFAVPGHDGITRFVDPRTGRWSDEPRPGYTVEHPVMGPAERRDLLRQGMEIGSHSMTHRELPSLGRAELRREIRGSKRRLEEELGRPVDTFCYPRGRFDLRVLREVRDAGYRGACCTVPGWYGSWPRFLIRRFLVERPDVFEALLARRGWVAPMLREALGGRA